MSISFKLYARLKLPITWFKWTKHEISSGWEIYLHVDMTIKMSWFSWGGKFIFHHFFHSAQGCFLPCGVASTHPATQEVSSTAPPFSSSPPPPPPPSPWLLFTCPWWKLLTGQRSMEQCGEVIIHTSLPSSFLPTPSLALSLSHAHSFSQYRCPQQAAQYSEGDCPSHLNVHSHRVTIFPDPRAWWKMRKTWPLFMGIGVSQTWGGKCDGRPTAKQLCNSVCNYRDVQILTH